jgi:glyoxylase-like metal-dependent hydrolase (beta-lactamase superfamily II)
LTNYLHSITIPTPFAVGPINVYLVEGDELTLVDTGPRHPDTEKELREALALRRLSLGDIARIIVTHAHVDHFGLAARIHHESGARVFSHPRNSYWLTEFENEWARRNEYYSPLLARYGLPESFGAQITRGMKTLARSAESFPRAAFQPLAEGDEIQLGPDRWQTIHAPGHASGLICLYEPKSRVLLSSDHLLRDITSNPVLEPPAHGESARPRALVDYLASMQRVARMDITLALPAHGEPIYDVRALVEGRLAFHRARLEHIERALSDGAKTPYELCTLLFPDLQPLDVFLGISEIVGHLDILEEEKRVVEIEQDGLTKFQRLYHSEETP